MFKKIFYAALVIFSFAGISQTDAFSNAVSCPNYVEYHMVNNVLYKYTYTCDGSLISVEEAGE